MRWTFDEHLRFAVESAGGRFLPAIVAKEMLHFDILRAIAASPLGDRLVFQGGTALRICHDGDRLSEDLDFVCGAGDAEPMVIEPVAAILDRQMTERYGLAVDRVKGPKGEALTSQAQVKRWEFVIKLPLEGGTQRIRVEICNVPAHDAGPVLVRPPYPQLEHLEPIVLKVESLREVMADKLLALGARGRVKYRDVWDLKMLTDRGVAPDIDLVRTKIDDYGFSVERVCDGLAAAVALLKSNEAAGAFTAEMTRFVSADLAQRLAGDGQLAAPWLANAVALAVAVREQLLGYP